MYTFQSRRCREDGRIGFEVILDSAVAHVTRHYVETHRTDGKNRIHIHKWLQSA